MKKTLIIAEAGVNHNGDLGLAKKLVDIAVEAGADIVKFQTFKAENLVTGTAKMAKYQIENMQKEERQFDMLKRLELKEEMHFELFNYCKSKGIGFLSTPFDVNAVDFLSQFNLGLWKIPSGEITNLPYLRHIGRRREKVILSTGMSNLQEIGSALTALREAGTALENITVLHCNTEYPSPFSDINLNAMKTIHDTYGVKVGYSDHTAGIEVSLAAVALGATLVEKHFTIDKNMPGPDHKASLDPQELKALVTGIRNIEQALGSSEKKPSASEQKNIPIVRKSIVTKAPIRKGEVFTAENLTVKRPGSGVNPMKWDQVLGSKSTKDYGVDEMIEEKF